MVLDYYSIEKTEQELAKLCSSSVNLGTDDKTLKRVAEELGFKVDIKLESSFEDITYWLERRVPLIVDWFTRGRNDYDESIVADGHYSVVIGLDDDYIYLQDPEIGKERKILREDFLKVWFDFPKDYIESVDELILRQIIAIYR
jgi:ABC-type bacteriocin/lantibiotic exporter with double-glycine peptidase domain